MQFATFILGSYCGAIVMAVFSGAVAGLYIRWIRKRKDRECIVCMDHFIKLSLQKQVPPIYNSREVARRVM